MGENKSNFIDKFLVVLLAMILPIVFLFIGVNQLRVYITGIPFIIYGIIGLLTKRAYFMKVWWSSSVQPVEGTKFFYLGKESMKISFMYIIWGILVALIFYLIRLYVFYKVPEIINYL